MTKHTLTYDHQVIEFELIRKPIKNINLYVKPDMGIVVSANEAVPFDYILEFVRSKARWLLKQVGHFKGVQPEQQLKKSYLSGESFKYLGKQYRLKVKESDGLEGVRYYRGYIYLTVRDKENYDRKEKLIKDWYKTKATEKFQESLKRVYPIVAKYDILMPHIKMRLMKARWGSCLRDKKTILINSELIKAPKLCMDYVILHELIHFKYKNHDNDFYDFMTSLMPDWKQRKAILDEEVVREL